MDLFILNSAYEKIDVVDTFESLIWTDRFKSIGDFELVTPDNHTNRTILPLGTRLQIKGSSRIQVVETMESQLDNEGRKLLTFSGRSSEKILEDRVLYNSQNPNQNYYLLDTPLNQLKNLYTYVCQQPTIFPFDVTNIPYASNTLPDTLFLPNQRITLDLKPQSLYKAMTDLADNYAMGFRIIKPHSEANPVFNAYMGRDRTTRQSVDNPVIFSASLDNLSDINEINSNMVYKNVAVIGHKMGVTVVSDPSLNGQTPKGLDRRAIFIDASSVEDPLNVGLPEVVQKGLEALSNARPYQAFDGKVNEYSNYVYDQDYYLGDLVEMHSHNGMQNLMRVTEQIFISDREGDRTYPTLDLDTFITPGSWSDDKYKQNWSTNPNTWSDA